MDKFDLQGIAAATFTPMKPNGDINTSILGEYVTYLVENQGVTSIFLNGTSGEGMSLSTAERKKLLEAWLCAGRNRLKYIIVNISCSSITDCKELAKHAEQVGASAVAITSPSYFCPATPDALVDFLQAVSLEAGSLPIIYYHIPVMSHIPFLASTILEAIGNKIPNFAGFKFSDMNLFDASLCMHNSGRRCTLYYGVDEQMLTGMFMGAQAAIGSTYNYFGSKNIEMLSLLQNGKFQDALNIQISLQKRTASISKTGITVPENKVVMSYISGIDMGPPRSPLTACGASRTSQLHRAVDSLQSL